MGTIIRTENQDHYEGITQVQLLEVFDFDFDNGDIFAFGKRISKLVKASPTNLYPRIRVKGKIRKAHCVMFLAYHGFLPPIVDHENKDKSDLSIYNLRASDHEKNVLNISKPSHNTSGHKHIYKWKDGRKNPYQIYFGSGRDGFKKIWLDKFETLEEALAVLPVRMIERGRT